MKNKRQLGNQFERLAADYLTSLGYKTISTNYSCSYGEIDIIAIYQKTLILIEVKARKNLLFGQPHAAVTPKKLTKIANTGQHFRSHYAAHLPPATRIDVVSILYTNPSQPQIQHFTNVLS